MATTHDFKFSANTNCLRDRMKPAEIAALLKRVGLDGIEWGLPALESAPAAIKEMMQVTADQGLEVAACINAGQLWKTDLMRRWSEAVAAAGCRRLRVGQPWVSFGFDQSVHQRDGFPKLFDLTREGFARLAPLSREFGIQYVVEIHMGGVAASPATARALVEGLDPKAVGFIYDPANTIFEGFVRPRTGVELLGPYLSYVHVKNLILQSDASQPDPTPGIERARFYWKSARLWEGMLDWAEMAFALKVAKWTGWLSMEEFFAAQPEQELTAALAFLKDCLAAAPAESSPPYAQNND
jgi:sugar phosphate isomerase/epimerase